MSAARPYIPDGYDHQGRIAGQHSPAEACTELGADTAPARPGLLRRIVLRLRIAGLHWAIECVAGEREHSRELRWVGPIYLRESYAQQRRLMSRAARLQAQLGPARPAPAPRRQRLTLATALIAIGGAVGLVLAACGGGGTDEQPAPRPQIDCPKTPEQCK
ncbi:hypothetical protein [Pelomonas sp. Root1444]|uniref:hypothetical protein n=1 Tax=Pelomonas sp. Root1444 TaxID=1736464 RepID=UPI000702C457|nr:hypothetical protein [Pelomonas sp. Root1444]KQY83720.1 hypothetical protein ASD35_24165 [Pelomonas sp. Root1444]